jgi:hypothetical protein
VGPKVGDEVGDYRQVYCQSDLSLVDVKRNQVDKTMKSRDYQWIENKFQSMLVWTNIKMRCISFTLIIHCGTCLWYESFKYSGKASKDGAGSLEGQNCKGITLLSQLSP